MILFRWDESKASSNKRKHGISFEDAILVFDDPFAVSEMDCVVEDEPRWKPIGMVEDLALVLVAHTVFEEGQDEVIRVISARLASRKERMRYEQNCYENPD